MTIVIRTKEHYRGKKNITVKKKKKKKKKHHREKRQDFSSSDSATVRVVSRRLFLGGSRSRVVDY